VGAQRFVHQSWGLPSFTETALATGSTSVTAGRMEDRKTLRRHEVACVRQVVGMNLTAEWLRIRVGQVWMPCMPVQHME
jgi:hypothetical protein